MFPALMLSAALSLSPPQPILIPSDMLRTDPVQLSSRRFNLPRVDESINLDAKLKLLEQMLENAKKAESPRDIIEMLQNTVDEYRERRAKFDKRDDQSKNDGPKKKD